MDADVPLLIPEVNAAHVNAIPVQQKNRGYDTGFMVTNPNCSTAGLVLVLKPLADAFGVKKFFCGYVAGILGSWISGRPVDGRAWQCYPFYQWRGREDGSGATEAAG